jgi:Dyp-type peroxidase family
MKRQSEAPRPFNDPPSTQWEAEYQGDIHALIIVAHDYPDVLARITERILSEIYSFTTAVWYERGARLQFQFPRGLLTIEHFGFEDGVSNPLFILQDIKKERASRGGQYWDPAAPLSLVLVSEPGAQGQLGSFFAFRKLEQNVRGFKAALKELAAQLGLSGAEAERAGAMAVGRFRDGAPIVSAPPAEQGNIGNDFTFLNSDPQGNVCPFQAHIRKTNPRGDTPLGVEGERAFRIARRGITYGERPDLKPGVSLPPPEHGVGLLFMSFQARLDQFAIQQEGSDSDDFARQGVGVDAVIGQSSQPVAQEWPQSSGQRFTIANFVMLKGGEYFFAPSMAFLYGLASADGGAAGS